MPLQTERPSIQQRSSLLEQHAVGQPNDRSPEIKPSAIRLLMWPTLLAALAAAALCIDVPLARWLYAGHALNGLKKLFDLCEIFGHGVGVAIILVAVWVLAPERRSKLPRLICCAYLAGLVAILLKFVLARSRPNQTPLESIHSVIETFGAWFPGFSSGSAWESFPSGHTATAVGLALGLAWFLPRGKWLFAALVFLVALQRMVSGYHYASDTLFAAAIGWLVASALLPSGFLSAPFDRIEKRLTSGG